MGKKLKQLKKKASRAADKLKFPSGADGRRRPFARYKPQTKKIEKAAKAKYKVQKAKGTEPETLKGTGKILKEFEKGRKGRKKEMKGLEKKVERPDFKDYKKSIKDIRKGKGDSASYAYSGRFKKLGEQLGVGYSPKQRRERTESRFESLKSGLKSAYETPAQSSKRRRELGRQAMASMRID